VKTASWSRALEEVLKQAPAAAHASRAQNLDAFLRQGFPSKALEDWRYTDLAALAGQDFTLAQGADVALAARWQLPGTERLVFVNGHFRPALSHLDHERVLRRAEFATPVDCAEKDAITHLNAALATDGLALRLPKNAKQARPLHVLSVTVPQGESSMSHLTHSITLEPGAEATVIFQDVTAGAGSHLLTQRAWLRVMDGARLNVVRLQEHGEAVQALTRWDAGIERDATLDWINADFGGQLVRNDLVATLAAPGARLTLDGVYAIRGTAHVDNHTRIDHLHPHGTSRETYRGIVADRARAVFNGKIVVHPDARKTDSEQHVANLLLNPGAEVDAKPELQIDNDDVKCAHGATVGQLDEDAIYYLRSRGVPQDAARNLLLYTFAHEVLGRITPGSARTLAERVLLSRLPGGLALEELL